MANCCCTDIAIFTDSENQEGKKQLNQLYACIQRADKGKRTSYGIDLKDIVRLHGKDPGKLSCRGTIVNYSKTDTCILISQDDAWEPKVECWREILSESYIDLQLVYMAEEVGSGIFINTDEYGTFFPTRFRLAYYPENEKKAAYGESGDFYFPDEDSVIQELAVRTNCQFRANSIEEARIWAEDHEMSIDEFTDETW